MTTIRNIIIADAINSTRAVNFEKAEGISKEIIKEDKDNSILLDFSNIRTIISPFMRSLIFPLKKGNIKYEVTHLPKQEDFEMLGRIEAEFAMSGGDNWRNPNN